MYVAEAVDKVPALANLDRETFRSCCPAAFVERRQPPDTFFEVADQAESFSIVITGRVKLHKRLACGSEATLEIVMPGNLLCMGRPHACSRYCCDAVADAPNTRVLVIPRQSWMRLMDESSDVARYFIEQLGARNELLCKRVEELSSGRVEQRLMTLLSRLAQQIGRVEEGGLLIPLKLSRGDLAELTATTPETATRIMRRLEKAGALRTTRRGIVIEDVGLMEAAARHAG